VKTRLSFPQNVRDGGSSRGAVRSPAGPLRTAPRSVFLASRLSGLVGLTVSGVGSGLSRLSSFEQVAIPSSARTGSVNHLEASHLAGSLLPGWASRP
jgi:hypothetical protein